MHAGLRDIVPRVLTVSSHLRDSEPSQPVRWPWPGVCQTPDPAMSGDCVMGGTAVSAGDLTDPDL
jgi:hypothetical protein